MLGILSTGEFPDYQGTIPEVCERSIEVNRKDFLKAVERVTCLCAGDDPIRMRFEAKQVDMRCRGDTVPWEANGTHPIGPEGPEITTALNWRFLMDGLRTADSETISIDLTDAKSAVVIRGEKAFRYIVMPLELPEGF